MQQFSKTEVVSLSAKIRDRCGCRAELAVDRIAGYGSVLSDREQIRLDLCQRCVKILFGQWMQKGKIA
ncbi:Uncharacterised protein [Serratia proteamaculans]|uniref:hypothetical protein n=1 Tax=Serratia proteamaculans TaxID=28151 RepID=UPI002183A472|nr:hypothetical protein [Serratia proteamaculans]CAI2418248.1 Uncharacterised protein [Serratia proteamaculans]